MFKASFTYVVGSQFTLTKPEGVNCLPGKIDGVAVAPDGDLLVGGRTDVYKVNPRTGTFSTIKPPAPAFAFHLMLDPTGTQLWVSGVPGPPGMIPLAQGQEAKAHALVGDDTLITTIAWDSAGNPYYTSGGPAGGGPPFGSGFGRIDFATWTTKRIFSDLPAAHGMTFDPYTGDLILMGSNHLTQISVGTTPAIVSDLETNLPGFDQGTVDGQGHLFAACPCGSMLFVDYSVSRKVADPANFRATLRVVGALDDLAPLVGPGVAPVQAAVPPKPVVIEEQGRVRIVLPAAILFDFDKYNLKPSAEGALAWAKTTIIDKYPGAHLIVEGHTDDRGSDAYNLKLGAERAQSVADWLKRHGTPASLVETHSYGKSSPRYLPVTTEENRARNRRVEIIVVK